MNQTNIRNRINKLEYIIIPEALLLWQVNIGKPDEAHYRMAYQQKVDESFELIQKYFGLVGEASRGIL